jgi:hypothetical protein
MSYQSERLARKNGLAAPLSTKKERKPIAKKSAKKLLQENQEKEDRGGDDTELVKWFKARIKYSMTGFCEESGLKTETKIYRYAINSCCHILEKRNCKSVKYHPLNFVELIPDLHHKFDSSSWEEREKWACWPVIRDRLVHVYLDLAPEERRFFPQSVLDYMEKNNFCD